MILAMMGAPSAPAMIMMLPAQFSTSCTHAMIVLYFALARCALCDYFVLAQIHLHGARCAIMRAPLMRVSVSSNHQPTTSDAASR